MDLLKHGPGRPPKFGRPSHAVTVTLPEDVLARLRDVDGDLSRAIVTMVERRAKAPRRNGAPRLAELAAYGKHAVILVNQGGALGRLRGVQLVPAGNGRALISLEHSSSIAHFELALRDAVERNGISDAERRSLTAVIDILRRARKSNEISLEERSIIVLESKRRRPGK